jgi:hypothetical protein
VEEDAKSKALRYKEWEKREQDKGGNGDENDKKESSQQDKKAGKLSDQNEEVWAQLNEHDKRKEYKRARKVMDALKAVREEAANG